MNGNHEPLERLHAQDAAAAANEPAANTPTSPSSQRPTISTDGDDGGTAEIRAMDQAAGAVASSDSNARSPSPDSPAPFSYTAPGVAGHGRAASGTIAPAAGAGGRSGLGVCTASSGAMGTPELSPTKAAINDVSSLAALVAAVSPPSSTLKREVSAADLASDLVSEGVEEPTMGEAAALLVLSNNS